MEKNFDFGPCDFCGTYTGNNHAQFSTVFGSLDTIYLGEINITRDEYNIYNLKSNFLKSFFSANDSLTINMKGSLKSDSIYLPSTITSYQGVAQIQTIGGVKFNLSNDSIICNFILSDDLQGEVEFKGSK